MEIRLYSDGTVPVDFSKICDVFGNFSSNIAISWDRFEPWLSEEFVLPDFGFFKKDSTDEITPIERFFITQRPFYDNFFYHGVDNYTLLSLNGWDSLTDLPIANGIVYHICRILLKHRMGYGVNHTTSTGCMNDFMWDKTIVDAAMRAAYHCNECRQSISNTTEIDPVYLDVRAILDYLSARSRKNEDVTERMFKHRQNTDFDVFLCHNSKDKSAVRALNLQLSKAGIKTWFDEDQIRPGDVWQDKLESQIETIKACVVIVGDSGEGPWQEAERRAFISEFISRNCRIIPVLLGNGDAVPKLPIFLRQFMWSDLRNDDKEQLNRLIDAVK